MDWYHIVMNEPAKLLPRSQGHAGELWVTEVAPTAAEIAFVTGVLGGDITALKIMATALSEGKRIICQCCAADIHKDGHGENCTLASRAAQVRHATNCKLARLEEARAAKKAAQRLYKQQVAKAAAQGFVDTENKE
jgi:hypothetical protein